jgi:cytochrome c oxidase cbb3-type subunit 3
MKRLLAFLAILALVACHRERRPLTPTAADSARPMPLRMANNQPGPKQLAATGINNPYEGNAYAISQGQQLFEQYNCSGCHFHGGGGIGPPLMDAEWIYGADPENIIASIVEGRPNGMPSFRGRISNQQLWELAAYVRSMSGLAPKAASSGRDDDMQVKVDEQRTPIRTPNASATRTRPPGSERP